LLVGNRVGFGGTVDGIRVGCGEGEREGGVSGAGEAATLGDIRLVGCFGVGAIERGWGVGTEATVGD
jgi:hypothetical protein